MVCLNEGSAHPQWFDWAFGVVVIGTLVVIGHACVLHLHPETSIRRRLVATLALSYVTWWTVLLGVLVTQPQLDVSPRHLVKTALFFHQSEPFVGPTVGLACLLAFIALVITIIRERPVSDFFQSLPLFRSALTHRLATVLAFFAPGLFLFSRLAIDLITRQHVERITFDSDGNVVTLVGPQLTSFLWSAATSVTLGLLLILGIWFMATLALSNKLTLPTFRTSFIGVLSMALIVRLGT